MSVYDYAENAEKYARQMHNFSSSITPKPQVEQKKQADDLHHLRMTKRSEAKFSVEFDFNKIMKNELEKVQQFKDTVRLLEETRSSQSPNCGNNNLLQGMAHQIHLCFRSYVSSDIKGYVKNFGANEVTKETVSRRLKVFSGHMMTILEKLVDGMNQTYLKHFFSNPPQEEQKTESKAEEFERLANQWSMHQLSPRTLNLSITSIQSAISKEIMWDPIENTMTREINIPSGIQKKYKQFLDSPSQIDDEEKE